MKATCDLIFVYGTLRRATGHRMAKYLAENAAYVGAGKSPGRLFDFGVFPGMLPAEDDDEWVTGEVWRLLDVDATLPELDRYEGCVPAEPQPWIFRRDLEVISMDDGDRRTAWVYWYCGDASRGRRIVSGDFLNPLAG